MDFLKKLKKAWIWLEENFLGTIVIVMGLDILIQIITRKFFNKPLSFTEELARNLQVWLTFFGMGLCLRRNEMIRMEILYNKVPKKYQSIVDIVIYGFMFWVSFMLIVPAYTLAMNQMKIVWDTVSSLKLGMVLICEPIGFAILSLMLIGKICIAIKATVDSFRKKKEAC